MKRNTRYISTLLAILLAFGSIYLHAQTLTNNIQGIPTVSNSRPRAVRQHAVVRVPPLSPSEIQKLTSKMPTGSFTLTPNSPAIQNQAYLSFLNENPWQMNVDSKTNSVYFEDDPNPTNAHFVGIEIDSPPPAGRTYFVDIAVSATGPITADTGSQITQFTKAATDPHLRLYIQGSAIPAYIYIYSTKSWTFYSCTVSTL